MMRNFSAVLVALALIGTSVGAAQTSIGVGMQYMSFGGSDFDGTDAGMGFEANVMFPAGKAFMLGASGQWSTHNNDFSDDLTALGIFGEGRYLFRSASGSKLTPYVGGRLGWARGAQTVSASEVGGSTGSVDLTASGLVFGGGAGVMIGLSPSVSLDINGMIHSVSFGDTHVQGAIDGSAIDDDIPDSSAGGTAMQLRAGISFKLGGRRQ
jgi:hypothetical protein